MLKSRQQALDLAGAAGCEDKVILLGYRSATSKYGKYDDLLAIITPDTYGEFKGNTLPSRGDKGIAVLQPGAYKYRPGLHGVSHLTSSDEDKSIMAWLLAHKGQDHAPVKDASGKVRLLPYWAYRQAGPVTILRIGDTVPETIKDPAGWPWIDLHKGGYNLTSSLGCQTFYPDHWEQVRSTGFAALEKYGQVELTYILHQEN